MTDDDDGVSRDAMALTKKEVALVTSALSRLDGGTATAMDTLRLARDLLSEISDQDPGLLLNFMTGLADVAAAGFVMAGAALDRPASELLQIIAVRLAEQEGQDK